MEWRPNESTVLMTAGEDDKTTMWDLSLEADTRREDIADVVDLFVCWLEGVRE